MSDLVPTMSAERAAVLFAHLRDYRDEGERRGIPEIIKELHAGQGWKALGYDTWQQACDKLLGGWQLGWSRDERREIVPELRDAGMSTRAIGAALGVDQSTVVRDLAGDASASPEPKPVTGLDGKTYTPQPRPVAPVIHIDPDEVPDDEVADVLSHLEEFAEGGSEVQLARERARFAKWMYAIHQHHLFDPEQFAGIYPERADDVRQSLHGFTEWATAYLDHINQSHTLRVITGE